ncbi:MAG TPA: VWA domain-containing protein [Candidatus Binatia bacterium]|nr:VWA domain-containing protein [Candidatus Binatia bacterium]
MKTIIRAGIPTTVLLVLMCVSGVFAQGGTPQPDGWQGSRPTPQQSIPTPAPQRSGPSGKQVLEIPSRPQQSLPPPRQQTEIAPRPQSESPRPTQLVTVTVTDPQGRYVSGLRPEDFVVYEDGVPQDITYFNTGENEPVSLGLIVDVSGSMISKIDRAKLALRRLLDTIHPQDEVFIEAFNSQPFLLQDFTDSRLLLSQAISALRPVGGTALYDAILDGLHRVKRGRHQKKALIVISDGLDTASLSSLNQTVNAARRSGVLVYAIGIGNPNGGFRMGGAQITIGPFVIGGGAGGLDDEQIDTRTLQEASDATGGKLFVLNTADVVGNTGVLENATQTISRELRSQYSLGYTSSLRGSHYRSLRVETRRADGENLAVRTQKGYEAE